MFGQSRTGKITGQRIHHLNAINQSGDHNPVFMLSFIGTLPLTNYLHYAKPLHTRLILLSIASLIYITGTFGVTIFGNVPLNNTQAAFDFQKANIQEITHQRLKFEEIWNCLYAITVAAVTALSFVIVACFCNDKNY